MSFSYDLKLELYKKRPQAMHCRIAELAGILAFSGKMKSESGSIGLQIKIDHGDLEDKIKWLFHTLFHYDISFAEQEDSQGISKAYIVDTSMIENVFKTCKLKEENGRLAAGDMVMQSQCCKRSFLRGVYQVSGSMMSPEKSYQIEIACASESKANQILGILEKEDISGKMIERKSRWVVYLKDAEKISYLLGIIGASGSMMEFENVRIVKDIRNSINREVNCDAANIRKTTDAAVKVSEDIHLIFEKLGIDSLSPQLREMALLRLEYPDLPLKELGEKMDPPLGKSGVNHRLRKLSDIAQKLKN